MVEASIPNHGACPATAVDNHTEVPASVTTRRVWLPLLAALPWLLMAVAGLLWVLTSPRGVPHAQGVVMAQPIPVAAALVLAALMAGALNILVGTLSLLWKPTSAGALVLASGVIVDAGMWILWHAPA